MSEYLIFDGTTLDGPIECEDLGLLRNFIMRGQNRILPETPGRRALAPILDELDVTLTWFVKGSPSVTDVPQDPEEGLVANTEFYRALFNSPGDPDTGEHDITLHLSDFVFDGAMQVVEYAQPRSGPQTATILTRVRVPSGELEATGS